MSFRCSSWPIQFRLLSFICSVVLLFAGCASTIELTSAWNIEGTTIDGRANEWEGSLWYVSNSNASVGIRNDAEYIYVCFMTADRQTQMQILGQGFTVWFEPEEKGDGVFGVNFPIGRQGRRPSPREASPDDEEVQRIFDQAQREMEIVGPDQNDRQRLTTMQARGIAARLGRSQGSLVYELKVPLQKSAHHPFAVSTGTRSALKVGFETGEFSVESLGRVPPGGAAGVGTGRSGGRSGQASGRGETSIGGQERLKPFKLWTKVQLASSSTSAQP